MVKDDEITEAKSSVSIPKDTPIVLPSRGLLYGDSMPGGETTVTPMGTKTEKMLWGAKNADRLLILEKLLDRHLDTKGIPQGDILIGDRMFALMVIRNITYGPEYTFRIKCDSCGEVNPYSILVPDDLQVRVLEEKDAQEPIEVQLPYCGKTIGFRHLRGKDELALRRYTRNLRNQLRGHTLDMGDPAYTYRMALAIMTIAGQEVDTGAALRFIETEDLHGADSVTLQNAMEDHACGVDLRRSESCPECGALIELVVPFTAEFFRPSHISVRHS